MSLINKVIRDLEEREAFFANQQGRIFRGLTSADNPLHKNKLLTANLFAVLLFLLASVSVTYALMEHRADEVLADVNNTRAQKIDTGEVSSPAEDLLRSIIGDSGELASPSAFTRADKHAAESALQLDFSLSTFLPADFGSTEAAEYIAVADSISRIESISLSQGDNTVLLKLELASAVDYRAYTLTNPDRIVVEIDDAVFDGPLPDIAGLDGIKAFRMQQKEAGKLVLVMDTLDLFSINDMLQTPSTRGYALKISLASVTTMKPAENDQPADPQLEMQAAPAVQNVKHGEMKRNVSANEVAGDARRMFIDAQALYRRGRFKQANELLTALLAEHGADRAARSLLAKRLIEQGQLSQAEELLKTGLGSQAGVSEWANLYARLLVNKGDINTAIDILTSVTPAVDREPDYYAFLAALYQKIERHNDAARTYRRVLQVSSANSIYWMGLAISLEALQQKNDALYAYQQALLGNKLSQDLQKYVHSKINYLNKSS